MEKRKKKKIYTNSIFTSTLAMLLILAIGTMLAMWFYVSRIYTKNQKERIHELNRSQIYRVSEDMDTRLTSIGDVSEQMLFSKNSVSLMTRATAKDSDTGARIIADLNSFVAENPLVDGTFMYLPTTGEIFSYNGTVYDMENYPFSSVLQDYLEIREENRPVDQEITTRYVTLEDELFLISDFAAPYFIGAMIIRIDLEHMADIIMSDDGESSGYFLVSDSNENCIVGEGELYADILPMYQMNQYEDVRNSTTDESTSLLVYHSEQTGLIYSLYVGNTEQVVNLSAMLLSLLPFILIYGVIALIYSLYITRRIYRPINRLMNITLGQRKELDAVRQEESQNEMEYLEQVFQDTWGENEQNRLLLSKISDDVLEQMLRSVISGRNVEDEYIQDTLQGLGMDSLIHSRFVVLSGWILEREERERSSMEAGIYRRSIRNFLNTPSAGVSLQMGIFMDQNVLAIILGFPEETSALEIKKTIEVLQTSLKDFTEKLPFSMLLGTSKTCQDISSLGGAFHEAYTNMEYLRYVAEAQEEEISSASGSIIDQKYFQEYGHRLLELAENDERDNTSDLINTMITEISEQPPEQWRTCAEAVMDILMERMIALHISGEEMKEINSAKEKAMKAATEREREDHLYTSFRAAVKAIFNNSRKSRYRYVDMAKDYISSHYSDGNLSLNEVAEAVGISAPYLSGIFAESESVGFSAYLSSYRVAQAKQYLTQTTQNITEIGYKCGFNSAQSFSRVFKKYSGFTPGQYREYYREQNTKEET